MFVEIVHSWDAESFELTVTLRYFVDTEATIPVHEDVLVFSVARSVGPPPHVSLNNIPALRNQLYDRMGPIATAVRTLTDLRTALSQLPPGMRIPRNQVLRMLEGALNG